MAESLREQRFIEPDRADSLELENVAACANVRIARFFWKISRQGCPAFNQGGVREIFIESAAFDLLIYTAEEFRVQKLGRIGFWGDFDRVQ